jgi:hypothetical protein
MKMTEPLKMADLFPEPTRVDGIETLSEAEERGFYLYREATVIAVTAGSLYYGHQDSAYPLDRNQAIVSGLLIRLSKFMKVIVQLASDRSNGEIISASYAMRSRNCVEHGIPCNQSRSNDF